MIQELTAAGFRVVVIEDRAEYADASRFSDGVTVLLGDVEAALLAYREDIGLKLETVSRLFSRFQADALIAVEQKHVRILDIAGLERVLAARS